MAAVEEGRLEKLRHDNNYIAAALMPGHSGYPSGLSSAANLVESPAIHLLLLETWLVQLRYEILKGRVSKDQGHLEKPETVQESSDTSPLDPLLSGSCNYAIFQGLVRCTSS